MSLKSSDFTSVMDELAILFKQLNMKSDEELDERKYEIPEYSLDISDSSISIKLEVQKVNENQLTQMLDLESNSAHVKFTHIGPTFTDINYSFVIKLPTEMLIKNQSVCCWDDFVEVDIDIDKSGEEEPIAFHVGTSLEHLQEILIRDHHPTSFDSDCESYSEPDSDRFDSDYDSDHVEDVKKILGKRKIAASAEIFELPNSETLGAENMKKPKLTES